MSECKLYQSCDLMDKWRRLSLSLADIGNAASDYVCYGRSARGKRSWPVGPR